MSKQIRYTEDQIQKVKEIFSKPRGKERTLEAANYALSIGRNYAAINNLFIRTKKEENGKINPVPKQKKTANVSQTIVELPYKKITIDSERQVVQLHLA